ncbi:ABC transporter substrate-binding protein [Thioclava sp. GXIMD2076]|uniref:ABC transporter substrate-binding protein n=1 Tax=Thioclava kandeliae TaxID=3070818 RepID=A0ABV1SEH5_9RHOB
MTRLVILLVWLCAGMAHAEPELRGTIGHGPQPLLFRSNTDLSIMGPVIEAFTEANPDVTVQYEQWTANGLYEAASAACRDGRQGGDVVFSSAVQQMVELVNGGCAQPHQSEATRALPAARRWRDELWGLTEEPSVIVYNKRLIRPAQAPRDRFQLLDMMRREDDRWSGRFATYDIEQSGLGYLFAYSDSLEATTFGALLEGFARSNAVVTCCSAQIIDDVSSGKFALAYNMLGSYVMNHPRPDVAMVLPEDYTLFLSRAYMIPKRARHPETAKRLLDFLLSADGQEAIRAAGLIFPDDPQENGLLPSARRFIGLSPALLVALDHHTRRRFSDVWSETFTRIPAP